MMQVQDNTTSPILTIDHLVKRYGSRTVLDDVNLQVRPGEIVCIIGPSGSGKSTLLRCVNGLEDIQGGAVMFEGMPVRAKSRDIVNVRRRIGMIFQQFNLYPHLTALQNITLSPVVVGKEPRKIVDERARALLERVRLSHRMDAYPGEMSGGEQQRVAIARALASNPAMLMFDEPTSALDPELVGEVLAVMKNLAHEGRTMLVVTHEIRFARDVASRIIFMEDGRIVEEGEPEVLLRNPKSERTRQFLSSILADSPEAIA